MIIINFTITLYSTSLFLLSQHETNANKSCTSLQTQLHTLTHTPLIAPAGKAGKKYETTRKRTKSEPQHTRGGSPTLGDGLRAKAQSQPPG